MFVTRISRYIQRLVLSVVSSNRGRTWNLLPVDAEAHLYLVTNVSGQPIGPIFKGQTVQQRKISQEITGIPATDRKTDNQNMQRSLAYLVDPLVGRGQGHGLATSVTRYIICEIKTSYPKLSTLQVTVTQVFASTFFYINDRHFVFAVFQRI
jgi:hypothetical protein